MARKFVNDMWRNYSKSQDINQFCGELFNSNICIIEQVSADFFVKAGLSVNGNLSLSTFLKVSNVNIL